jgi:hypothetical protein
MTVSVAALLGLVVGALGADLATKSLPLTEPYTPHLETRLVTDGRPQALVLLPEDPEYAAVAEEFLSRFEQATGVRLPVLPEADFVNRKPEAETAVLLGNFATGPLALRLYANKLICSDGVYPGPGGFELRTIPDALDLGADILFFGGSSAEGVRQAMDSFFDRLKPGNTISVSHLIEWQCQTEPPPASISDEEIEKQVAQAGPRSGRIRSGESACGSSRRRGATICLATIAGDGCTRG